jgi:phage portal protein BeeE
MRGTTKERYDAYAIARERGWMSVNEIRERENLNPIAGGDDYTPLFNGGGRNLNPASTDSNNA